MFIYSKIKKIREIKRNNFEDISMQWLQLKRKSIKQSSYANYSYSIKKYLIPELGNLKLKALKKYDFNNFVEELSQDYAPKTVRDIVCNLKSVLYFIEDEYNCNLKVKNIISPKLDSEPLMILTQKEKNKLENYCIKQNTLRCIGIIICLNTGLRIGEMCALRWKDIDLEKREIHIRNTLQRIYDESQNKTKIIIDKPKTRTSIRNIPISNKLYYILLPFKNKYNGEEFFLTGEKEKYFEPRTYQYIFKDILKACRVKKYKFHILRHTFATNCIEVGMDVKSLSEILGHASVEITLNKYVHSSYRTKKKYLEKL